MLVVVLVVRGDQWNATQHRDLSPTREHRMGSVMGRKGCLSVGVDRYQKGGRECRCGVQEITNRSGRGLLFLKAWLY